LGGQIDLVNNIEDYFYMTEEEQMPPIIPSSQINSDFEKVFKCEEPNEVVIKSIDYIDTLTQQKKKGILLIDLYRIKIVSTEDYEQHEAEADQPVDFSKDDFLKFLISLKQNIPGKKLAKGKHHKQPQNLPQITSYTSSHLHRPPRTQNQPIPPKPHCPLLLQHPNRHGAQTSDAVIKEGGRPHPS